MTDLARGEARPMSSNAFSNAAAKIGCDPAVIAAIWKVEAGGKPFDNDGRLKILCEKHVFYKYLRSNLRACAVELGLARRKWVHPSKGGYKDQRTVTQRYQMLADMIDYSEGPGWMSFSMGGPQMMGFNADKCGFANAREMFEAFRDSEDAQLQGLVNFVSAIGLNDAMRDRDWKTIARKYNGSGQVTRYATALEKAYKSAHRRAPASFSAKPVVDSPEPTKAPESVPNAHHKPLKKSHTMWSGGIIGTIFAGMGAFFTNLSELGHPAQITAIALCAVGVLVAAYIMRRRILKFARGE